MKKEEYINPFSAESEAYAKKIDDAEISGDIEKLEIVLKEAESTLLSSDMASQAQLYYSIGTAYSCLAKAKGISQEESIRKQLYCFRKSIDCIENPVYSKEEYVPYINGLKRLLYTNYANTLSECGRKIEAIFQYKKALNIDCNFGMVLGNLGIEYKHYGLIDYDNEHQHYFHHFAYTLLRKATECKALSTYAEAKEYFCKEADEYSKEYVESFLSKYLKIPQLSYENAEEEEYRKWAVKNSLFLNTLNDLPVQEM